jgi:outer membrane biosynthesis protein TonB
MKVLSISRNGLELARTHLNRPVSTIGRSPICDVVLRASEVAPIHFLFEWVGSGPFDPTQGSWSVFDISRSVDRSGEGAVLSSEVEFGSFKFKWIEDTLENAPEIGGKIRAELQQFPQPFQLSGASNLIELVQVRSDTGAVEEVLHLDPARMRRKKRPLEGIPEFMFGPVENSKAIQILLEEMPGAKIFSKGLPQESKNSYKLEPSDLIEVRWKDFRFFLRLVDRVPLPAVEAKEPRDPLLLWLSLGGALFVCLGVLSGVLLLNNETVVPPPPPPRVATVEIKLVPPPPPPQEEPKAAEPMPVKTNEPAAQLEKAPVKAKAAAIPVAKVKAKNVLAAPKFKEAPQPKKLQAAGLNAPDKKANVNQIGILGELRASAANGPGVRADMIMNAGVISKTVSGSEANAKVTLQAPPSGTLGNGTSGSPHGARSDLATASTTLVGGGDFNPDSNSPITGGHGNEFSSTGKIGGGSSSGDPSTGLGGGTGGLGNDTTGPVVSGGLDRETVRRIINQNRGEIRTCYEKALLSNPAVNGRIVYTWHISSQGPVVSADITRSTAGSPTLEKCVKEVIKLMHFPVAPNGMPTTVIYPFVFQAHG